MNYFGASLLKYGVCKIPAGNAKSENSQGSLKGTKHLTNCIAILIILLVCAPTLAFRSLLSRFYGLVVFGGSHLDTGNVYTLTDYTWPLASPYYRGRFCNGPVWVNDLDVLIQANYAFDSATTDNKFVQGYTKLGTVPVPGLRQQVAQYLSNNYQFLSYFSLRLALHIVWAGGDDYVFNNAVTAQQIINSLSNSLVDLLRAGVKTLLVFNQPPAQYFPLYSTPTQAANAGELAREFNTDLKAKLATLKESYPQASISLFDTHSMITDVLANSQKPPTFTNNSTACWTVNNLRTVTENCPDATKYVFLDNIHFTSTVHRMIADAVQPLFSWNHHKTNLRSYITTY